MFLTFILILGCLLIVALAVGVFGWLLIALIFVGVGFYYYPLFTVVGSAGVCVILALLIAARMGIGAIRLLTWRIFPKTAFERALWSDKAFGQQFIVVCEDLKRQGARSPASNIIKNVRTKARNGYKLDDNETELASWASYESRLAQITCQ